MSHDWMSRDCDPTHLLDGRKTVGKIHLASRLHYTQCLHYTRHMCYRQYMLRRTTPAHRVTSPAPAATSRQKLPTRPCSSHCSGL